MRIKTIYKNAAILVETISATASDRKIDLVITENHEIINKTTTIIEIRLDSEIVTIACYWSRFSEFLNFSYYWSENEKILFIGAGCVSAIINPLTKEIIVINYPEMFWGWECIKGYILELGELRCRLYTPSGELVGEAAVDPPYEYKVTEKTIEFSSIVFGETKIEFKK